MLITTANKSNAFQLSTTQVVINEEEFMYNNRPMIGIMTEPIHTNETLSSKPMPIPDGATEYIAASYVKWVESGGARVVPIRYTWPKEKLLKIFRQLNGLLLPGGGASLEPKKSQYYEAVRVLWDYSLKERNRAPVIFGTCLGFEQLSVLAAGSDYGVLSESGKFNSEDQVLNVQDMPYDVRETSRLFKHISPMLLEKLRYENATYHSHEMGVTPEVWESKRELQKIFSPPLAYGRDKSGKKFVSIVESTRASGLNIYAVQFHPEKPLFEWSSFSHIPHSNTAMDFGIYLARFFVEEAKKNKNRVIGGPKMEQEYVIENGGPDGLGRRIYLGTDSYFMEFFVW